MELKFEKFAQEMNKVKDTMVRVSQKTVGLIEWKKDTAPELK